MKYFFSAWIVLVMMKKIFSLSLGHTDSCLSDHITGHLHSTLRAQLYANEQQLLSLTVQEIMGPFLLQISVMNYAQ